MFVLAASADSSMMLDATIFLGAAVILIPLAKRFGIVEHMERIYDIVIVDGRRYFVVGRSCDASYKCCHCDVLQWVLVPEE